MKRSNTIIAHTTKANAQWIEPEIVVKQFDNGDCIKQVTITIRSPWDLHEVEQACKQIREYWKSCL